MNKENLNNLILCGIVILLAATSRLVPHIWNFTPLTAAAIFAGVYLPKKQALVIPLAARFASDIFLGFFAWPLMLAVYASHLFGALMGFWVRRNKSFVRVAAAPIVSALVFFLVTNFAWLYPQYAHNWSGIILSYTNGLPFLRGTLLGDVAYTMVLVGCYELAKLVQLCIRAAKSSTSDVHI